MFSSRYLMKLTKVLAAVLFFATVVSVRAEIIEQILVKVNGEIFTSLREAEVLIESWRRHYNAVRPHSSLGYRPPAPEAILPPARGLPYAALRSADRLADRGRILI